MLAHDLIFRQACYFHDAARRFSRLDAWAQAGADAGSLQSFDGNAGWINSAPLTASDFRRKINVDAPRSYELIVKKAFGQYDLALWPLDTACASSK